MARPVSREPFNAEKAVFAKRAFTANGRRFAPGDVFPWRQMAVAQRKVGQLYDSGRLTHAPHTTLPQAHELAQRVNTAQTVPPTAVQEQTDLDVLDPNPDAPRALTDVVEMAHSSGAIAGTTAVDELDFIDDLSELRAIAEREGAEFKRAKADQREAIRARRAEQAQQ